MITAVNGGYEKNDVWLMMPNGDIKYYKFGDIKYPYIYVERFDTPGYSYIAHVVKEKINVLTLDGIKSVVMNRIELPRPSTVYAIRQYIGGMTVESNIKYLERRIGADGVVEWTMPDIYLYLDIETDGDDVSLIGVIPMKRNNGRYTAGEYFYFENVDDFAKYIDTAKITTVIAWNGTQFDYRYLNKYIKTDRWKKINKLDGMNMYSYFKRSVNRGLDFIAREEGLGGKLDINKVGLIEYNKHDVELLRDILEKNNIVKTFYEISAMTGIIPKIEEFHETWLIENYIMKNRGKFGVYLKDGENIGANREYTGGMVYLSKSGIYENVAVYDYNSLYPSVFFYEMIGNEKYKEFYLFWRNLLLSLYQYKEYYRNIDDIKYNIFKVLVNAGYGVFGLASFRYFNVDIAEFITAKGRERLQKMKSAVEAIGKPVIYMDTDSVFVLVSGKDEAVKIEKYLNETLAPYKIKIDKYYKRILFPSNKQKDVKKRYAGITDDGERVIVGLEAVRKDWCILARETQEVIIDILLSDIPAAEKKAKISRLLEEIKNDLKNKNVPPDKLKIIKTVDMEKEYKVKTQSLKALEQMERKDEIITFVEFYLGKNGTVIVDNGGNNILDMIDWKAYYENQIKAPTERLLSVFENNQTLDDFLGVDE